MINGGNGIIKKSLIIYIFIMCIFTICVKTYYAAEAQNQYQLNTQKVQKVFYKNGLFSSKGLEIIDNNNKVVADSSKIDVENIPNLTTLGDKEIIVTYNNKEYNYNISVIDNHPGDIFTLKDGSKWYFLEDSEGTTKLLSVYHLMQVCETENCEGYYLTFLDKDDLDTEIEKEAPYDNVFKTKYNIDNANNNYQTSDIKKELDNNFSEKFLNNLSVNGISNTTIQKIQITLPDNYLIARIAGISNYNLDTKSGYSMNKTSLFLSGSKSSYWLKEPDSDRGYGFIVNNQHKLNLAYTTNFNFSIRPQITISNEVLNEVLMESDNSSDGELDNITAPNYLIYDAKNDVIIREKKSLETTNDIDTIYPASMTKLATAAVAIDKLEKKVRETLNLENNQELTSQEKEQFDTELESKLNSDVTIHSCINTIQSFYDEKNYTADNAKLKSGDVVTYKDLIAGSLYPSGWDATVQLAISFTEKKIADTIDIELDTQINKETFVKENGAIDGKITECHELKAVAEYEFAKDMNQLVEDITGVSKENLKTNFVNTSGLMAAGHVATMYDIAKIFEYAMTKDFIYELENLNEWTTKTQLTYTHPSAGTAYNFMKKADYFVGNKPGAASGQVNGELKRSLINNVAYFNGPNDEKYIVVIATASCAENRNSDMMYVYQWLYPGQIGSGITTSFDITFNKNNGLGEMSNQTFTYNEFQKIEKNTFTKKGYKFIGWNTKADGTGTSYSNEEKIKLIENITLYAQWEAANVNYTVKHYIQNANDDEFTLYKTEKLEGKTDSSVTPSTISITGMIAPSKQTITIKSSGDSVVEYKYTRKTYTLNISKNNSYGTLTTTSLKLRYGVTYTAQMNNLNFSNGIVVTATPINLTGYDTLFIGWSSMNGTITGNSSIEAMFGATIKKYTVSFESNNNSYGRVTPQSITIEHGTSYNVSGSTITFSDEQKVNASTVNKTGYQTRFSNWSSDSGTLTADETIYANFTRTPNEYTISYDCNNGTGVNAISQHVYDRSQKLTLNMCSKKGYKFLNWNTNPDGTGEEYLDEESVINLTSTQKANIKLYAIWEEVYSYIIDEYEYNDNEKIIDLVSINTNVDDYKQNIYLNQDYTVDVEYKLIDGQKMLYTGSKTRIYKNSNLVIEYINVIKGDVNGDGQLLLSDIMKIANYVYKDKNNLAGVYLKAADYDNNSQYNLQDIMKTANWLYKGGK